MSKPTNQDQENKKLGVGMAKLRALLDPDRATVRLIDFQYRFAKYFECNGCDDPQGLVGQMFDEIYKNLGGGGEIEGELEHYLWSAARNKLHRWIRDKETRKRKLAELEEAIERLPVITQEDELLEAERTRLVHKCFDDCRARLSLEEQLILDRYLLVEEDKAAQRLGLAECLMMTIGALRQRAARITAKMRACVAPCLESYGVALK